MAPGASPTLPGSHCHLHLQGVWRWQRAWPAGAWADLAATSQPLPPTSSQPQTEREQRRPGPRPGLEPHEPSLAGNWAEGFFPLGRVLAHGLLRLPAREGTVGARSSREGQRGARLGRPRPQLEAPILEPSASPSQTRGSTNLTLIAFLQSQTAGPPHHGALFVWTPRSQVPRLGFERGPSAPRLPQPLQRARSSWPLPRGSRSVLITDMAHM